MQSIQKIVCPACNHAFHAEEVISRQLTRDLERQFREKEESLLSDFQKKMNMLESREKDLETKKLNRHAPALGAKRENH